MTEQKHKWRVVIVVGMIVAFLGPWAYDRINVPAQYECTAPNIRLDGDFCGVPVSGIQGFLWLGFGFISISSELLTGKFILSDRISELLISFLLFLPVLPVFSTLFLTLRPTHPRRRMFSILPWILAIGVCVFLSWSLGPKQFLASWGLWFYMGLAVTAFALEIAFLTVGRKRNHTA